jgi:hypothetical protein
MTSLRSIGRLLRRRASQLVIPEVARAATCRACGPVERVRLVQTALPGSRPRWYCLTCGARVRARRPTGAAAEAKAPRGTPGRRLD